MNKIIYTVNPIITKEQFQGGFILFLVNFSLQEKTQMQGAVEEMDVWQLSN